MAELSTPDTGYGAAAAVQMEEGLAVDGKEYVVHKPATAIAPAEVDTLNTSREDISVVVELSPAASGLDQPAAAEHLNAVLGAELAAIFAQLGADTSTGCASMSTEVTRSVHRPDAVAKDGSVLAVTPQDDPETAQAAATDEGAHLLAIECVSEAADDAAAETQISSCLPAEPAQVLSQQSAATPTAAADFQDSFRALERDSDADLPAVIAQHDAAAPGVQSAPAASTSSPAGGTPGAAATSRPGASPANGDCWRGHPLVRPSYCWRGHPLMRRSFTVITVKQGSSIAPACTLACCAAEALQQPPMGSLSRLSHMAGHCLTSYQAESLARRSLQ
ncbi:TPA: hypothetical protein ACH3X1_000433 [Trebouxia sp. C0004]